MIRVALVDDNDTTLLFMEVLMRPLEGLAPLFFTSSAKALEYLLENPIDLLIVDYMMPDLNGIELVRQYRQCPLSRGVPIIMITAYSDRDVRAEAMAAGVTDFLGKPLEIVEFHARFRNLSALRLAQRREEEFRGEAARSEATADDWAVRVLPALLVAINARDGYDAHHATRLSRYARILAQAAGMTDQEEEALALAATVYDIGKLGISDTILGKGGPLTSLETQRMREHCERGQQMLTAVQSPAGRVAAEAALYHHERQDGTGYPFGLAGDAIPKPGRLMAVVDVLEALTQDRPYRPRWSLEAARAEIAAQAGTKLDAAYAVALLNAWDEVVLIARHRAEVH